MEYSDGYVAFIDILGFSNYVLEERNAEKISDLFSFVEKFCYLFNTSPQLRINVSFFSDSIVLSADELEDIIIPIYIAESYLKSELKLLFRGGITKGKFYHSNGITFGPAVITAYHLEKQAIYSRILVDDIVMKSADNDCAEVFRDTDGKWCLNLNATIVYESAKIGSDELEYPSGDPVEIILNDFKKNREAIIEAIKTNIKTPVADKYIWRIKPFNYLCEFYAKNPQKIPMFQALNYNPPENFIEELLKLRISNFDYEMLL